MDTYWRIVGWTARCPGTFWHYTCQGHRQFQRWCQTTCSSDSSTGTLQKYTTVNVWSTLILVNIFALYTWFSYFLLTYLNQLDSRVLAGRTGCSWCGVICIMNLIKVQKLVSRKYDCSLRVKWSVGHKCVFTSMLNIGTLRARGTVRELMAPQWCEKSLYCWESQYKLFFRTNGGP